MHALHRRSDHDPGTDPAARADNGTTSKPIGETASDRFELKGLDNEIKFTSAPLR
jgi:hypothetical protein